MFTDGILYQISVSTTSDQNNKAARAKRKERVPSRTRRSLSSIDAPSFSHPSGRIAGAAYVLQPSPNSFDTLIEQVSRRFLSPLTAEFDRRLSASEWCTMTVAPRRRCGRKKRLGVPAVMMKRMLRPVPNCWRPTSCGRPAKASRSRRGQAAVPPGAPSVERRPARCCNGRGAVR